MEKKKKKIKATTEFETITEFKLLNYDELPFKFISQTNLYKGDLFGQFVLFSKHNNYVGTCIALRKTKIVQMNTQF